MIKKHTLLNSHKPRWIRWPAVCLVVTFLTLDIAQTGWTMPSSGDAPLSLPAALGTVELLHQGTNGKTLFYIQDAHSSLEAQENIAKIIQRLVKKNQVTTVFEEGYQGTVPTEWFREAIPDEAQRKKAAWHLLDHLRLGGAEYAHITRGSWIVGRGLNKKTRIKGEANWGKKKLKGSEKKQKSLVFKYRKAKFYHWSFNTSISPFNSLQTDQIQDFSSPQSTIHYPRATPHDFQLIGADDEELHRKNIQLYREVVELSGQTAADLKRLKSELIHMGQSKFPKPFWQWLALNTRFHQERLDLLQYFQRSQEILRLNHKSIPEVVFPQINLILQDGHSQDLSSLNARELYQELDDFEEWMARMFLTKPDREIWRYLKKIQILESMNTLTLSSPEFETLSLSEPNLGKLGGALTSEIGEFVFARTGKPMVLSARWELNLKRAREFYQTVEERHHILESYLKQFSENKGADNAVLVFGGFHQRAILRILESQGWSYVVIAPRIKEVSSRHESIYHDLMTKGKLSQEVLSAPSNWVTQERLFNLVQSPEDLKTYLRLNLPGTIVGPAQEKQSNYRSSSLGRSEVRVGSGTDTENDPWDQFRRIGVRTAKWLELLQRKNRLTVSMHESLLRAGQELLTELQAIETETPSFNAESYQRSVSDSIQRISKENERLLRFVIKAREMPLTVLSMAVALVAFYFVFKGAIAFALMAAAASAFIQAFLPLQRFFRVQRASLPRFMLPDITKDSSWSSELKSLQKLTDKIQADYFEVVNRSSTDLRTALKGNLWISERLDALALDARASSAEERELKIYEEQYRVLMIKYSIQDELRARMRKFVLAGGIIAGASVMHELVAVWASAGLLAGTAIIFFFMRSVEFIESQRVEKSPLPQEIRVILDYGTDTHNEDETFARSEVRSAKPKKHKDFDKHFMRKIEIMTPSQLVQNIYQMAQHPQINTNHASFLFDMTNDDEARVYIGYGPHGSLIFPSENPSYVARFFKWKTRNKKILSTLKGVENLAAKWLYKFGVSSKTVRSLLRRYSLTRTEMPVDQTGAEARRFFFRGHFKITGVSEASEAKPAARLAIKPPYSYEDEFQSFKDGLISEKELEEGLYGDLVQSVRFLLAGGLAEETPLSLQEFSHMKYAGAFLAKNLKVNPDKVSYETTLGEFIAMMPKQMPETVRSEVRSATRMSDSSQDSLTIQQAASFLQAKKWRLPGSTMVYPAAGTDIETVIALLKAKNELSKAVLIDPWFQKDFLGDAYRLQIARSLSAMPNVFISQESMQKLVEGNFNAVTHRLEINLLLLPPWHRLWESSREIQLVFYAEDYLKWQRSVEESGNGFALTLIKNPGMGASMTMDKLSGSFFYHKAMRETVLQGVVYITKAYAPTEAVREEFRLEWMNHHNNASLNWKPVDGDEWRIPEDQFWLVRNNGFRNKSEFVQNLDILDYEAVNPDHINPYLVELVAVMSKGRRGVWQRVAGYSWLAEFFAGVMFVFIDILQTLIQFGLFLLPLLSKSFRGRFFESIDDYQFRSAISDIHYRHTPTKKKRIVLGLFSRLFSKDLEVARAAMRALLAAGSDTPAILEGLRLHRDEFKPLLDEPFFELLDSQGSVEPARIREALYSDYAARQEALDLMRSEVRSQEKDQVSTTIEANYRLTFPSNVVTEWLLGREKFYIEPLKDAPVVRIHLDREKWKIQADQFVSKGEDTQRRRYRQRIVYANVFGVTLSESSRLVLDADFRKSASFVTPGPVTLIRVDEDTLDVVFQSALKRSETRGAKAVIPGLLKKHKSAVRGETIGGAARILGVTWRGLEQHLIRHPDDIEKYQIQLRSGVSGAVPKLPGLLEKKQEKIRGKTLYQAAPILGVNRQTLIKYVRDHPKTLVRYGLLPQTTLEKKTAQLLEEHKRKIRGKNFTAIAGIIGKDLSVVSRFFSNNPQLIDFYGIDKGEPSRPVGRPKKRSEVRSSAGPDESLEPKPALNATQAGLWERLHYLEKKIDRLEADFKRLGHREREVKLSWLKGIGWVLDRLEPLYEEAPPTDVRDLFEYRQRILKGIGRLERMRQSLRESLYRTDAAFNRSFRRLGSLSIGLLVLGLTHNLGYAFLTVLPSVLGVTFLIHVFYWRAIERSPLPGFLLWTEEEEILETFQDTSSSSIPNEKTDFKDPARELNNMIARVNRHLGIESQIATHEQHLEFLRRKVKPSESEESRSYYIAQDGFFIKPFGDPFYEKLSLLAHAFIRFPDQFGSTAETYFRMIDRDILPALREQKNPWAETMPSFYDWLAYPSTYFSSNELYEARTRQFLGYVDRSRSNPNAERALFTRFAWYGPHLRKDNDPDIDEADHLLRKTYLERMLPILERKFQESSAEEAVPYAGALINGLLFTPAVSDLRVDANEKEYVEEFLFPALPGSLEEARVLLKRAIELLESQRENLSQDALPLFLRYFQFDLTDANIYELMLYNHDVKDNLSQWDVLSGAKKADVFLRAVFNPEETFDQWPQVQRLLQLKDNLSRDRYVSLHQRDKRQEALLNIWGALRIWADGEGDSVKAKSEVRIINEDQYHPMAKAIAKAGINVLDYTTLIYPAAGMSDAQLLLFLRTDVFPSMSVFHLDDRVYAPKYAVHDSLVGRKVTAGETMVKQITAIFDRLKAEPPSVHIYNTDYFSTRFDFSKSQGKRIWLDKIPGKYAGLRNDDEFYLSTLRRGLVRPGDLVLASPYRDTNHKKFWHQQIAERVHVSEYHETQWDVFLVTEEDFTAAGLPVPFSARSEIRKISAQGFRGTADQELVQLNGRYSVVTDVLVFNALSEAEQSEYYKLFEAYEKNQQVKFIFNAASTEDRLKAPKALRLFAERYSNVRLIAMPTGKISFNDEGRRILTVSKEGLRSIFSDYVADQNPRQGLLKIRYGKVKGHGGLLSAALLLFETQEPEMWKLADGGFLTEIPQRLSDAVGHLLASYLTIGTAA